MKILFLTQYFPPEIGAPQNRLFELAVRLQKKGFIVSILTAMPNYPKMEITEGYRNKIYFYEEIEGLKIYRSYIFVKKSKALALRLINYFSFVFSSLLIGIFKISDHDYIFCESPPLFLGITALVLSKFKKAKLIFNVSDLWPESAEKLGLVTNKMLLNISTHLEEYLYKKSYLITGQTQGIIRNIKSRFPQKTTYWLKNGVDLSLFNNDNDFAWRESNSFSNDDFLVFYGGIFGYAQGLEVILHSANILRSKEKIKFILMGTGPVKEELIELKEKLNLKNLSLFPPVDKNIMPFVLNSINASVIPLKKLDLFKGAIPSKIFEVLASKKPILLGVEGEAKEIFIEEGKCGLSYLPEDASDLSNKVLKLYQSNELAANLGLNGYYFVSQNFNRDKIANEFTDFLDSLNF